MSRVLPTRFLAFALAFALAPAATLSAQTIFVTTVSDVVDFALPQTVTQLPGPDGKVSMREAAIAANNTAGPQTIGFHVPMGQWGGGTFGPKIVNAGQPFPINGDDTTIDGTTQTLFTGDLNPNGAEVSFNSTTNDVNLIVRGIFEIKGDRCICKGLGDMTNRNIGLDFMPTAEDGRVIGCVIKGKFACVRVQGDRNTIGGVLPGEGNNLTSLADGLRIQSLSADPAQDNIAIGNVLSGEFNGIQIVGLAINNRVGGFLAGEANVISGAGYLQEDGTPDGAMVRIETDATGNFVLGNYIGTDATGTVVANNVGDVGVEIYGDGNFVIGNVIGGITGLVGPLSVQAGVSLREGADNNVIQGNWIGVDKTGTIPLGNGLGVYVSAFDASLPMPTGNVIGGTLPGQKNVIAFNENGGIVVLLDAVGNSIRANEIRNNHTNGGLGVDLGADGVTPNDAGDGDTGPNLLMNRPDVMSAVSSGAATVVTGRIDTASPTTVAIDLYANPAPGPGEIVEAATFIGTVAPAGDGSFAVALPVSTVGLAITAIATDAAGNSSEISDPRNVAASPWIDLGFGMAGTNGIATLTGAGTLAPSTQMGLLLGGAKAGAAGCFIAGASAVNVPAAGGTLVPSPDAIVNFVCDASGNANFVFDLPPGLLAPGSQLYVQAWFLDSGAANGVVAASNAIVGSVP